MFLLSKLYGIYINKVILLLLQYIKTRQDLFNYQSILCFFYSYSLGSGVCFLVMTDKTFSKRSAFSYLEDIQNEFTTNYGGHVPTARRPYCFIEFGEDKFIFCAYLFSRVEKSNFYMLL